MKAKKVFSLKFQVFIFTAISGFIPLIMTIGILYSDFVDFFEVRMEKEILEIAIGVAADAEVQTAFLSPSPRVDILQQTSNKLRTRTGAHAIFIDMNGVALIDPYPIHVRTQLMGEDKERVLQGDTYTSRSAAYSTPAIRAFAPVMYNGEQIGAVVAAFLEGDIDLMMSQLYNSVLFVVPLALVMILFLSFIFANNIKKRLFGMEPHEIGTRLIEREGILHSVKEGIIATDENMNITVVNNSAASLFPPDTNLTGVKVTDLIPNSPLSAVITSREPQYNKPLSINDNLVIASSFPLFVKDKVVGTVMTFSNLSEASRLAEELTGVKNIVAALRARTHEFSNKLHVISGLLQLESYDQAKKYVASVATHEGALMSGLLTNFRIHTVSGLLMGKASEAEEKRITLEIDRDSSLCSLPEYFDEHAIVIVLGNLIENAFDAAYNHAKNPKVYISVKQTDTAIEIIVRDNGPGIPDHLKESIYDPGFTTKSHGTGYGLSNAKNRINIAQGEIYFVSSNEGTMFYVSVPFSPELNE